MREGGVLALYASDRTAKTVTRWVLTESGPGITAATPAGLDGDGVLSTAGASSLRGHFRRTMTWLRGEGADERAEAASTGPGTAR